MGQQKILNVLKRKASKKKPMSANDLHKEFNQNKGAINKALKRMRKYEEVKFKLEKREYTNNRNLLMYVYWVE